MCQSGKKAESLCGDEKQKVEENYSYGWGIRHLQGVCMMISVLVLFMVRSSMGIAVLAMTDVKRINNTSGAEVYTWDKHTQGYILSSFFWGYMIMQIPAGLLAKRYGGKPILLAALLANAITCLTLPTLAKLGGWIFVCLARLVTGMTQACLFPASHTLLGRWLPANERTAYTGYIYSGTKIGVVIGLPICGLIADSSFGWPMIFYMSAVVALVTAAMWYKFAASSPGEHPMISDEERKYIERDMLLSESKKTLAAIPWLSIMKCRQFWAIIVANFGFNVFYIFLLVDLPTYLEKGLQISLKSSAALSALPYIGMWVGGIVGAYMASWVISRGLVSVNACRKIWNSIAFVGIGTGLVLMSFISAEQKTLALVTLVGSLALEGFLSCGYVANFLDLSPNYCGVMLSISNTFANIGGMITPILISVVLQNDPTNIPRWHTLFLMFGAVCILTNLFYVCVGNTDRQPWDDPNYLKKQKIQDVEKSDGAGETGYNTNLFNTSFFDRDVVRVNFRTL